jgi:transcriptional regulator with XRE-family HTH domain
MASLRDLVRDRLKSLGIRQQDFAERLGVDPRKVSAVLTGEQGPPLDQVGAWARALGLDAAGESELLDAMHLAGADDHVRQLVERLEERATTAERALARYRDRVGYVRYILDHVEPVPGGGVPPPTPTAADMLKIAAEMMALRNAILHGMPPARVGEPAPPVEPSGN